jgi:hypothetical protein
MGEWWALRGRRISVARLGRGHRIFAWHSSLLSGTPPCLAPAGLKTKIGNSCAPEAVLLVQRFRMTWVRMILHAAEEVTLPELPSVSVKKAKLSMHMHMHGESPIGQVSLFAIMWTLARHSEPPPFALHIRNCLSWALLSDVELQFAVTKNR